MAKFKFYSNTGIFLITSIFHNLQLVPLLGNQLHSQRKNSDGRVWERRAQMPAYVKFEIFICGSQTSLSNMHHELIYIAKRQGYVDKCSLNAFNLADLECNYCLTLGNFTNLLIIKLV